MGMGEKIRERRIALGMTQEELAQKLGVQKSAVAKYENGRVQNIKRAMIAKMANILECSPVWLMDLEEDDNPSDSRKSEETDTQSGNNGWYLDPEAAEIAQRIQSDSQLRYLFDAAKDATPEDIELLKNMLEALRKKERHED